MAALVSLPQPDRLWMNLVLTRQLGDRRACLQLA